MSDLDSPVKDVLESEGQKILEGFRDVELDPKAIDLLYHANPLVLTKAQRAVVIETIRRQRSEREVRAVKRASKKVKATSEEISSLTLDDLGNLEP